MSAAPTSSGSPVVPLTTASLASTYIPPFASASPSLSSDLPSPTQPWRNPSPTTPDISDDYAWVDTYLSIHKMSTPSYRYAYILWLLIVLFVLIFALLHLTSSRGGTIGAAWSKFSLRRRTWRKKAALGAIRKSNQPHRQPSSWRSNAQLLTIFILSVGPFALCAVGPDYIAPNVKTWDLASRFTRRALSGDSIFPFGLVSRDPVAVPSAAQPSYTIAKAWWTAGGRTGIIAFALFPLCVLLALKAQPFALFSLSFLTQLHFDKLAGLHIWTGRLIWFITTLHVATWGVQLGLDKRGADGGLGCVWNYVWTYDKFVYGGIGYVLLSLITLLSVSPIRARYYEYFHFSHIVLTAGTLVFSALHFPPIGWWCWSALILWAGERVWRWCRIVYVNGIFTIESVNPEGRRAANIEGGYKKSHMPLDAWELEVVRKDSLEERNNRQSRRTSYKSSGSAIYPDKAGRDRRVDTRSSLDRSSDKPFTESIYGNLPGHEADMGQSRMSAATYLSDGSGVELIPYGLPMPISESRKNSLGSPFEFDTPGRGRSTPALSVRTAANRPMSPRPPPSSPPAPGYARAVLLPGRTIRLTVVTARVITWAPGQHVLLTIPMVSRFTSHPFTIASVCDNTDVGTGGSQIMLLIRARQGFTKKLWDEVTRIGNSQCSTRWKGEGDGAEKGGRASTSALAQQQQTPILPRMESASGGVLLRAIVDGPYGSSARARWGAHSTVVLVAGGSGVSFTLAVLEYLCLCIAGRDGHSLGGRAEVFKTNRIRFVWLVREYSHILWCASVIRRCIEMVPREALQVDLFVSNFVLPKPDFGILSMLADSTSDTLAPPAPPFAKPRSSTSSDSEMYHTDDSMAELGYSDGGLPTTSYPSQRRSYATEVEASTSAISEDGHVLDLTNFNGEEETRTAAEVKLSMQVRKEGKLRRARSRKKSRGGAEDHSSSPTRRQSRQVYKVRDELPSHQQQPQRSLQRSNTLSTPDLREPGSSEKRKAKARAHERQVLTVPNTPTHPSGLSSPTETVTEGHSVPLPTLSDPKALSRLSLPEPAVGRRHLHSPTAYGAYADARSSPDQGSVSHVRNKSVSSMIPAEYGFADEDDVEDLKFVSELARPGKPKLDRILGDEVKNSSGATAVGCCGPTSLDALVRKVVAAHINPARVRDGDPRGNITLISEDFEW